MSWVEWTYASIAVLVLGAPLVFIWFLGEVGELLRGLGRSGSGETEGKGNGRETRPG